MDPRLERLLDLLDGFRWGHYRGHRLHLGTPSGQPDDAAIHAAELGLAASTTELTVRGLRDALEAFAQRAVLDAHYRSHPNARPDLALVSPPPQLHERSCMRQARTVVLHDEAVQALADPAHHKHRRVLAVVEAAAARNLHRAGGVRLVVPTCVRVEAGWNRRDPGAAVVNRLRIDDVALDT